MATCKQACAWRKNSEYDGQSRIAVVNFDLAKCNASVVLDRIFREKNVADVGVELLGRSAKEEFIRSMVLLEWESVHCVCLSCMEKVNAVIMHWGFVHVRNIRLL